MLASGEIVIVGAGPTGLTIACLLYSRGVPCRVIDQSPEPTAQSRAIGMSPRSLEVLDGFAAGEDALAHGNPLQAANLYSRGKRLGRLSLSSVKGTRHQFVLAIPQHATERILIRHLQRLGGSVERDLRLLALRQQPSHVSLSLGGAAGQQTIEAGWVIGADGAHSMVRKLAGIDFEGSATRDVFAIVDADVSEGGPSREEAHYYFSPEGLLVVIPLPDGSYRFAATVAADEPEDSALQLESVQELIARRASPSIRIAALRDAGWGPTRVRIHARIAAAFRSGRCLLAGDAAHVHSPVGGQGMNLGIQDAQNLAWKLSLVSTGKARNALLDSYELERRPVAKDVLRATMRQTRLATVGSRLGRAARDRALTRACAAGVLDRRVTPVLAQTTITYKEHPEKRGREARWRRGNRRRTGTRIPDTSLDGPPGAPPTLYDLLAGEAFSVLALAPQRAGAQVGHVAGLLRARYEELVTFHAVWPAGSRRFPAALIDRDDELHRHLAVTSPHLYLVRPDMHIAYEGSFVTSDSLIAYLDSTLILPHNHATH
jgi:2-polyprenyl-6-methoxyphenol hydroxylase-like FAD-dependent oxidoreductase